LLIRKISTVHETPPISDSCKGVDNCIHSHLKHTQFKLLKIIISSVVSRRTGSIPSNKPRVHLEGRRGGFTVCPSLLEINIHRKRICPLPTFNFM